MHPKRRCPGSPLTSGSRAQQRTARLSALLSLPCTAQAVNSGESGTTTTRRRRLSRIMTRITRGVANPGRTLDEPTPITPFAPPPSPAAAAADTNDSALPSSPTAASGTHQSERVHIRKRVEPAHGTQRTSTSRVVELDIGLGRRRERGRVHDMRGRHPHVRRRWRVQRGVYVLLLSAVFPSPGK